MAYGTQDNALEGKSKGLLSGTLTAQLNGTSTYLYSAMYYDNRGRIVQTKSNNHLSGGKEFEYIAYNFTGQPTKKKHVHTATGKTTQTEVYDYTYDHALRLTETKHNGTVIAKNEYDELGRLKANTKGGKFATTYAYNVRSWTTNINSKNGATLLFNQNLAYNTGATPQYGGNVSGMTWSVGATGEAARTY